MRLFIAIELEELKDYLKELQKKIPEEFAKLKPVSSFHLTLKFLGDTDKSEEIKESLKKIRFEPFKLELDELGVFPSESYIKVIWIGLKEEKDRLTKLQKDIEKNLEQFHFRKDFEFKAHVTLARVKFVKDREKFFDILKKIRIENKKTNIKNFKLIESTLTKEGPVYKELASFS